MRAIGRLLKISIATVVDWIKKFSKEIKPMQKPKSVEIIEMDEMYHWIGSKKRKYGSGLQYAVIPAECLGSNLAIVVLKQEKNYGKKSEV